VKESKRLVKCFLNYLRHDKSEVGVLFDMLSVFLVRSRIDYTFLKEFYIIEVGRLPCFGISFDGGTLLQPFGKMHIFARKQILICFGLLLKMSLMCREILRIRLQNDIPLK
jgi:hypothetical protein